MAEQHPNEWYLNGIREGNTEALEVIFNSYLPVVTGFICRNSGTREDARDIFMDAMESLFKKLRREELVLTCAFSTYLFEICKRLWLNKLRRKKYDAGVTPEEIQVSNISEDMVPWLENTERHQLLRQQFALLSEDCRNILALSWRTSMDMKEIAEQMGLSYKYVRKRKSICKERLVEGIKNDPRFRELY